MSSFIVVLLARGRNAARRPRRPFLTLQALTFCYLVIERVVAAGTTAGRSR
ncbi:MAG: hypothetical protein OXS47_04300 [Chloroflexota bacterium]|nr:hypothetical protein [Chloroflexota bacterium]